LRFARETRVKRGAHKMIFKSKKAMGKTISKKQKMNSSVRECMTVRPEGCRNTGNNRRPGSLNIKGPTKTVKPLGPQDVITSIGKNKGGRR
jgi:hypothetical protein